MPDATPSLIDLCAELVAVSTDLATGLRRTPPNRILVDALAGAPTSILLCRNEPGHPIFFANNAFTRATGFPLDQVLGRGCSFLQGPGTDPAAVQRLREALGEERACVEMLLNYKRDGTPFWNELHISPVASNGRVGAFLGIQHVLDRKADPFLN